MESRRNAACAQLKIHHVAICARSATVCQWPIMAWSFLTSCAELRLIVYHFAALLAPFRPLLLDDDGFTLALKFVKSTVRTIETCRIWKFNRYLPLMPHIVFVNTMSSTHNNHVIKCFTYDWLIRFMDLSPGNATNKLAAISPLFNQCASKYAPVFINLENNIYKAIAYNIPSNIKKKTVYTGKVCINNSNELSKLMHPCFYFHLTEIAIMRVVSLEFIDLKRLLGKSIENQVILKECKFKMPVLFSELWSLVCHCEDIRLDVDNLDYDVNIATIAANSEPCYRLTHLELYRLPPSVDIVYPIVSHSITTRREKGALILFFSSDVSGRIAEKIADAIRYKVHLADFKFFTNASSAAAPNMVRFIFKKNLSLDN